MALGEGEIAGLMTAMRQVGMGRKEELRPLPSSTKSSLMSGQQNH